MNFRSALLGTALVAALAMPLISCAADEVFMTVRGTRQGDILGGVIAKGHENAISVAKLIVSMALANDPQNPRRGEPVLVTVPLDRASTPLYNAATSGEPLSLVQIEVWRNATTGSEEKVATIALSNAHIASYRLLADGEGAKGPACVEMGFIAQSVTVAYGGGAKAANQTASKSLSALLFSPFAGSYSGTFAPPAGDKVLTGAIKAVVSIGSDGKIQGTITMPSGGPLAAAEILGTIDQNGNVDATASHAPAPPVHLIGALHLLGGHLVGKLNGAFNGSPVSLAVDLIKG